MSTQSQFHFREVTEIKGETNPEMVDFQDIPDRI